MISPIIQLTTFLHEHAAASKTRSSAARSTFWFASLGSGFLQRFLVESSFNVFRAKEQPIQTFNLH